MHSSSVKTKYLYLITLLYFALGFINIALASVALVCMILPFYMAFRDRKKSWCHGVCPRADLLRKVGSGKKKKPAPQWLVSQKTQRVVVLYFCVNIFFASMSTFMVVSGRMDAIDKLRFLMAIEIPWSLPQLWTISSFPPALLHLSYRFFSIMFSSTVVGLVLSLLYRPRTWCAICPVSTMTGNMITSRKSA